MNTQMPFIAAEQFVGSLTDQSHFDILSRALRDEVHRNDGRSRDWLFQALYDFWQGALKFPLVEPYRDVPRSQNRSCFRCICELIVLKRFSVTDGVRWPGPTLLVHQREKQTGIKPPAKKYSYWDVT